MFRRVKVIAGMGNIKYIEVSILRRWSNEYVHIGTRFNVGKITSMEENDTRWYNVQESWRVVALIA